MWLSTASGATEWVEKRAPGVMGVWILLHICPSSDPVEVLAAWEEPIFMSMSKDKMFKHLDGFGRKSDSVDSATRKSFHKKCLSLVRLLSSSGIPTVAEGRWWKQENYQIGFFSDMQVMSPANHSSMQAREAYNNFKLKVGFPEGKTMGWPCMIFLLILCPSPPPSLTGQKTKHTS